MITRTLPGMAIARFPNFVIDCPDPGALATFYGALLAGSRYLRGLGRDPARIGNCICFQPVTDYTPPQWPGQQVPQQMHLDVIVDDLDAAEAAVLELGATKHEHQPGTTFRVFLDPAAPVLPLRRLALRGGWTTMLLPAGRRSDVTEFPVTVIDAGPMVPATLLLPGYLAGACPRGLHRPGDAAPVVGRGAGLHPRRGRSVHRASSPSSARPCAVGSSATSRAAAWSSPGAGTTNPARPGARSRSPSPPGDGGHELTVLHGPHGAGRDPGTGRAQRSPRGLGVLPGQARPVSWRRPRSDRPHGVSGRAPRPARPQLRAADVGLLALAVAVAVAIARVGDARPARSRVGRRDLAAHGQGRGRRAPAPPTGRAAAARPSSAVADATAASSAARTRVTTAEA